MLYGHSIPGQPESHWQTLEEHHTEVARLAGRFAALWGTPETASLLGRIHDTGKRSKNFQQRLRGKHGRVDHSSAAVAYLMREWERGPRPEIGRLLARLLAYPLLGHHGGMPDYGDQTLEGSLTCRLSEKYLHSIPDWKPERCAALPNAEIFLREMQPLMCMQGKKPDAFAISFLLRMLYSCLVDADFLDTERFCSPERYALRPKRPSIASLESALFQHLAAKGFLPPAQITEEHLCAHAAGLHDHAKRQAAIASARGFMLQQCIDAAELSPGVFSLIMPTGGGKTLSSLAFALRHAQKYELRRIILVVPYTSIIEQNADIFRQILGDDAVLEHHSNYVHPDDEREDGNETNALAYKLSAENWDATLIVTTSVQFFESLFAHRPSRCRKLHAVAKSVVILDEAQMLPVPFTKPCVAALRILAQRYGSSVVLCTATQPALLQSSFLENGFPPEEVRNIIAGSALDSLFHIFKRTETANAGILSDMELRDRLLSEKQVLCIVNSRKHARELFQLLDGGGDAFHLSARMTPHHRSRTLNAIRKNLADGLPCRVVSTSLIECGVDISFPVVMREKNGLDCLAQSAGRCNREGKDAVGRVFYFSSDKALPKRAAELSRRRRAFDSVAPHYDDLFSPECVRAYFRALYASCPSLDEKGILAAMYAENPSSAVPGIFQFAAMAREFRFIDEQTTSVIVENEDANALVRRLREDDLISPATLRALQRHAVQVYTHEFELMRQDGRIETIKECVHILRGGQGYSEKTGLDIALEQGLPVADLLF